jgi:hypothetical protein
MISDGQVYSPMPQPRGKEKMSLGASTTLPSSCSGDMYRRGRGHRLIIHGDGLRHFRQAEVQQLDSLLRDQNIRRLQIAMHDALAVRGIKRIGDLDGIAQSLFQRDWARRAAYQ